MGAVCLLGSGHAGASHSRGGSPQKALYASAWQCQKEQMDLRSLKPFLGWSAPLVVAMLTTGCGNYTSEYKPPNDGRARAVWREDRVVADMPDGANRAGCSAAVNDVQAEPVRYRTYYGGSPTIVIWRPWIVVASTNSATHTHVHTPASPVAVSRGGGGSSGGGGGLGNVGSGGSSSGGGGGSGNIGEAALVLVVVAMLTLPIINLGLGLGRPEPSKQVAEEIDKVNAYNDLARLSDSPCAAGVQ